MVQRREWNTSEQIQLFIRVKAISGVMDVRALLTEDIAFIRADVGVIGFTLQKRWTRCQDNSW